jgi:alpha-mannosidase
LHNERGRATLVSDGLAEYAVDTNGEVAITLVRATGELSRRELPERPGHAGWPARIPAAQGPGRVAASFAVAFDAPCADRATIAGEAAQLADDVLLPLRAHTWRDAPRALDPQRALVRGPWLEAPSSVQPLAIMPAESSDGLILRCVNYAATPARATWHVSDAVHDAQLVRLDETPCAADPRATLRITRAATSTALTVTLAPFAVATLHVR